MGDLTENFSRSEFACRGKNCCGNSAPIVPELVEGLQELSNRLVGYIGYRVPLIISSGFRCIKHNKDEGGAKDSRHIYADAADVMCPPELTIEQFASVARQVECFKKGGIGIYSNRLHLDCRGTKARWDNR